MKALDIEIIGMPMRLHPTGAVFLPERSTLLISDVHLGKVAHFRKFGAAVPLGAIHENFRILDGLLREFAPFQTIFLGDLFHSYLNREWDLFENWVAGAATEPVLVSGNHDIIPPERYRTLGIPVLPEWTVEGLYLTHHPTDGKGKFNVCGHVHPAIRLRGGGRQSLRLSCFHQSAHRLILPALGAFTGSHVIQPVRGDRVYAIVEDEVVEIG